MVFKPGWSVVGFPVENQDRPLNISVNMIIEDINSLNPITMDFRLEFYLTQKWTLTNVHCQSIYQSIQSKEKVETNNNPMVLKGKDLTNIWLPDAFFYNAKQVGPTTFDDGFKSLIVQFDGLNKCSFTYSLRLSALIPCPMNFRWFPVDKQVCRVSIRSGSYPAYQMVYSWLPKGVIVETKVPLLQHSLKMNYFQMNATVHDQGKMALFTWLIVDLTFIRIISYHVIQIYLPTIILMIISYCSLWMGNDIVAGRITLGVTTQLALITQFSGLKSRLPQVSYINALDVWMVSCMLFVFSTIIVTTLIIVINRHTKELAKQMQIDQTKSKRLSRVENSLLNRVSSYGNQSCISNGTKLDINHKDSIDYKIQSFDPSCDYVDSKLTINDYSEKIDVSLRFIYPLTFLLFNTLYWLTILTST
ncbi:glycine receptor subunit alpha-2 isoform X1 [Tetranychus urticae]|uniref:glycine receptor subunit alpha-2 isoform X1 n=2 Tax=Tetranychus urticae TaxID=32264 RepID=UPI000D64C29F|nr:glycine receptor subunit alpha-2 isoform X1 [Tetranychus urticae]